MTNQPPRPAAPQPLPFEIPANLEIEYVNLVRIAHSPSEIILDMARLLPAMPAARVSSRIVLSPLGAKLLYRALGENLAKYEASFGEIRLPGEASLADDLFRHFPPADPKQEPPPES